MRDVRQDRFKQAGHGIFMQSVEWLANLVAVIIALFATPELHARTIGFVQHFVRGNYASGFDGAVDLSWWLLCWLLVFCITRMTVSTAIVVGGLTIAMRFI